MRLVLLLFLLGVGFAASDATESGYVTGRLEQDTTWRDTVYVGGDVTKRGGRVIMDAIAFANCGKPIALEDAASLSMSRRAELVDSTGDSGSGATSDYPVRRSQAVCPLPAPPAPTLVCRWRLSYIIPLEEATAAKSPCCAGESQPQNAPNTGVLYNV